MKVTKNELSIYEQMGRAALVPGMQHMIELMQAQLDEFRRALGQLQEPVRRGPGRPKVDHVDPEVRSRGSASYWAKMTPEERSAEMRRRQQVAAGLKPGRKMPPKAEAKPLKMHPRDPRHPGHGAWLKTMRKAQKKAWDRLTPAQRTERQNRMKAGRGLPLIKLERAS